MITSIQVVVDCGQAETVCGWILTYVAVDRKEPGQLFRGGFDARFG